MDLSLLEFEDEISPLAHVFEHLVHSWLCCVGRLQNFWEGSLAGGSTPLRVGSEVLPPGSTCYSVF